MNKIFILLLVLLTSSFSNIKEIQGVYKVEYGIFGKLGAVDVSIKVEDDKSYVIKAKAYATGLAKSLSGGLVEEYLSKGKYIDGSYRPNYFKKITKTDTNEKREEFFFDYKKKIIDKKYYKKQKKRVINFRDLSNYKYEIKEQNKQEVVPYWSNEDILSLFFNVKDYVDLKSKGKLKVVSTVGASYDRKGEIDILIPDDIRYNTLLEDFNDKDDILIVKIYKKIFASKEGEFFLSINDEGLCSKAILKDVIMFGDVTATLEQKNSRK